VGSVLCAMPRLQTPSTWVLHVFRINFSEASDASSAMAQAGAQRWAWPSHEASPKRGVATRAPGPAGKSGQSGKSGPIRTNQDQSGPARIRGCLGQATSAFHPRQIKASMRPPFPLPQVDSRICLSNSVPTLRIKNKFRFVLFFLKKAFHCSGVKHMRPRADHFKHGLVVMVKFQVDLECRHQRRNIKECIEQYKFTPERYMAPCVLLYACNHCLHPAPVESYQVNHELILH
jgi:hypothetical protein